MAADIAARILVDGMQANGGVPTGTGSSAVTPPGGFAATITVGGPGIMGGARNRYLLPSVPLDEPGARFPGCHGRVRPRYGPGRTRPGRAGTRTSSSFSDCGWRARGSTSPAWTCPGVDAVIDAAATANSDTVVVQPES